jgi:prepilin-type N-terminal cleavage/methylation domain-containing protein
VKRTIRLRPRPASRRRGVTLVEMLVTVAMLVIIMTVLVQVFQGAAGAVSTAQALQTIDDQFRRADGLIRSDFEGVTARFTPPLDPILNLGYFEYGENEFADVQGEDCDDYVRFTAKAPEWRPFTGRMCPINTFNPANPMPSNLITVTSEYAEIIYFLRNGNLYRRVLLVAPNLTNPSSVINQGAGLTFIPPIFNNTPVSWQGVNDLSARPAVRGAAPTGLNSSVKSIVLNTLGDLTNRENRAFAPRFADDFATIIPQIPPNSPTFTNAPDGISDDEIATMYLTIIHRFTMG